MSVDADLYQVVLMNVTGVGSGSELVSYDTAILWAEHINNQVRDCVRTIKVTQKESGYPAYQTIFHIDRILIVAANDTLITESWTRPDGLPILGDASRPILHQGKVVHLARKDMN